MPKSEDAFKKKKLKAEAGRGMGFSLLFSSGFFFWQIDFRSFFKLLRFSKVPSLDRESLFLFSLLLRNVFGELKHASFNSFLLLKASAT